MTWIERTYHRRRRQEGLGRLTPIEFETIHHRTTQTATAAHNKCQPNSGQSRMLGCRAPDPGRSPFANDRLTSAADGWTLPR
ncbi:MAG: hypothetical protein DLM59_03610 [Pseudonocardiales bacterium]|nr:MAG: hypothetical protein DLM59_03610 [Pseudonocardiales bacterium]